MHSAAPGPQRLVARVCVGRLELTAAAGGAGFFGPAPRIVIRSTRGSSDRSRHEAVLVVPPSFLQPCNPNPRTREPEPQP